MVRFALATLLLSSVVHGFPWMSPQGLDAFMRTPQAREALDRVIEERRTARRDTPAEAAVEGVYDPVFGLIPTNEAVHGLRRFPEANHPFQPPGPTDQRGPCPGLNTAANHGYIPRSGIVSVAQMIAGLGELYNMGPDLAALLAVGGALDGGDIITTLMSIGGPDTRVGVSGLLSPFFGKPSGIAGHGKFNEGDASATRDDFYLTGDNISFQPRLFQELHQAALRKGNGTYSFPAVKEHFKHRYAVSKAANAQFYFNVPSALVVMGAYYFIPGFFSNGTIGAGGIANEASITSFYGARPTRPGPAAAHDPSLTYTHVPERIPPSGWYRRATPMTLVEAVGAILDVIVETHPQLGGAGADQALVLGPLSLPATPQALGCFLYNAVYANLPPTLFGAARRLLAVVNAISGRLKPGYKALGCQVDYPDASGTRAEWEAYATRFVGPAKEHALGSGWYVGR